MNRRKWIFIVSGILLIVLFTLRYKYRRSGVQVTIQNDSGFVVDTLILKYEHGYIKSYALENDDETVLFYKNAGESSYKLIVHLHNGTLLKTRGMYVEPGYGTAETILSDTIISAY